MAELKEERVEVIVVKDFPKLNDRAFISIYERSDGHDILKPSKIELLDDLTITLKKNDINFFAHTRDTIIIPKGYFNSRVKPSIMKRYRCYSSSELPKSVFIEEEQVKMMPESTEITVVLPDDGGRISFKHTPTKIVPRRKPTLTMSFGDESITFIATKANLKAFVAGFKDIIRMIISIEE